MWAGGVLGTGLEPSPLKLQLQPRVQEIILESKANHDGEDLSHSDYAGARGPPRRWLTLASQSTAALSVRGRSSVRPVRCCDSTRAHTRGAVCMHRRTPRPQQRRTVRCAHLAAQVGCGR